MSRLAPTHLRSRFVILQTAVTPPLLSTAPPGNAAIFDFCATTNPERDFHHADKRS